MGTSRREDWGTFLDQDGNEYHMIRGPRSKTWFENVAGEIVSPVQSNIMPAMCWMYAETEWFDPTSVMLSVACRKEIRDQLPDNEGGREQGEGASPTRATVGGTDE